MLLTLDTAATIEIFGCRKRPSPTPSATANTSKQIALLYLLMQLSVSSRSAANLQPRFRGVERRSHGSGSNAPIVSVF